MAYLRPASLSHAGADGPRSFDQQVLEHLDSLYGVAFRLTREASAAEDLVHDTIVKAVRAEHQYKPGTNLKAWLLRILTNTFINRHRRGGLERDILEGPDAGPLADRWIGASTMRGMRDPEREALQPLIEAEVRKALDELPEHFRLAIVLSDVEGMAYKEIAEIMGCPVGTVMSRLHRARKMLQTTLRDHAVALGIIEDQDELDRDKRAAAGDANEPVDLEQFRQNAKIRRKKGGK